MPIWTEDPNKEYFQNTILQKMNNKHAVVLLSGKCLVLTEFFNPVLERPDIVFTTVRDFRDYYQNEEISVMGEKRPMCVADFWLRHSKRRTCTGVVFDPNLSPDQEAQNKVYNLWKGFSVVPIRNDLLCHLYLEHLYDNIAQKDEKIYKYVVSWMADAVQHPGKKATTAIAMRGKQGVGKSLAIEEFGKIFGNHFVRVHHPKHLLGNFNFHLKDALLILADEAFWAGDKAREAILKTMITEDILLIEPKGKDSFPIKNYRHVMIASNHDWCVPAAAEERRFFVLDVGDDKEQDHDYFRPIMQQMDNGGRAALLGYLLDYDLSSFNIWEFPRTEALLDQILHSMPPLKLFWFTKLIKGLLRDDQEDWNEGKISKAKLRQDYYTYCNEIGLQYREDEFNLGKSLSKLVTFSTGKTEEGKQRVNAYHFPSLEVCRASFEKLIKMSVDWEDLENKIASGARYASVKPSDMK